jgi:hypothetical protein
MPNAFAHLVFYSWPLVVYLIYRKQALVPALVWSVFLGYMLLPARMGIDLPLMPTIGKVEMTTISAAVMCYVKRRMDRAIPAWRQAAEAPIGIATPGPPKGFAVNAIVWILVLIVLVTPILTVLNNAEPISAGPRNVPGLRLYDAFSMIAGSLFTLLPFLIGRRFLNTAESHVAVLKVMCFILLGYSLLALWEVRMSPQLNVQIYGFRPSSFAQHVRAGGYRPLVFLNHGLMLGILLAMSILATATLWRFFKESAAKSSLWIIYICWLSITLFLSKNLGASMIAMLLLPFVLLMGVRGQLLVTAILAGVVLLYPMLRGADYIPVDTVYEYILERNPERAQSFKFRLDNEEILLEKANEKPVFGWGSWGRNRLYDEVTGQNLTIPDGVWVIVIGTSGWVGYIGQFGLLTLPLILLAIRRRKLDISIATSGLGIVLAANLVDLIPNASLAPMTWLIAGSMMGYLATPTQTAKHPQTARISTARSDVQDFGSQQPAHQVRTSRVRRRAESDSPSVNSRYTLRTRRDKI